jgi:hypothetical protein
MLAGFVLAGAGSFAYLHHETWKKVRDWDAYHAAQSVQKGLRPVWIYVDIAEEYGGWFTTRPIVPDAIQTNHECVPGSIAYGPDNVQWVCVQPVPRVIIAPDQPKNPKFDANAPYSNAPDTLPANFFQQQSMPVPTSSFDLAITAMYSSVFGALAGFILWVFYRVVYFAVKG